MARITRAVVLGMSHYVTQRGNRRQQTFFKDEDYQFGANVGMVYEVSSGDLGLLSYAKTHLIVVPETKDAGYI